MKRQCVHRLPASLWLAAGFLAFLCQPAVVSQALSPPAEGEHYCAAAEYEQWLRDNPPPAAKVAAQIGSWDRNRRTVRMIYFHPAGTEFRENVVDSMQAVIRLAQTFYGEQMAAHGYGDKTFRIETDADGEPLVHHVTGQHEAGHYEGSLNNYGNIDLAIRQRFSFYNNVYLVFVDHIERPGASGWGSRWGKHGGDAMVKVRENDYTGVLITVVNFLRTAAHELGHAFGLDHDFRDRDNVMSYGRWDRISACAAAFLSVHPYFNDDIPLEEESLPTFEVISSDRYPSGATGLFARIKVSDAEGVHQVNLGASGGPWSTSILACRVLSGEKDAVVEFEYEFLEIPNVVPEALLQRVVHLFFVDITDIHGNDESGYLRYVEVSKDQVAVLEGHGAWVRSVAFSPDGTTLASGSSDGTAKLWDVASQEAIATLYPHRSGVTSVDFSPDGKTLAGTSRGAIVLWDVVSGEEIAVLAVGGRHGATSVVFSPDGATVAFGLTDGRVKLWDVASQEAIATLEGHSELIESVAFSPDGTTLASGSRDGTAKLWDVASREAIATLTVRWAGSTVSSVAFSPDGTTVAVASEHRVGKWDVASLEEIGHPEAQPGWVRSVAFSPDGTAVASGDSHGSVEIWDVSTGYIVNVAHIAAINSVAFSPDGTTLAAGSIDGKIVLWDMSPYFAPVYRSADLDGDGEVGFSDFVKFTAKFGTSRGQAGYDARCDLDSDGAVGFSDFLIFAGAFGKAS